MQKKCMLLAFCIACLCGTAGMGFADVVCVIDADRSTYTANGNWDETDLTKKSWVAGLYTVAVVCTEDGQPVEGYSPAFEAKIMREIISNDDELLGTFTVAATPTDKYGTAYFNTPLFHLSEDTSGSIIHLCPFDDINQCQIPGGLQPNMVSFGEPTASLGYPFESGNLCKPYTGCCEVTVTIFCNPPTSYTFCYSGPSGICPVGTIGNSFIQIQTSWDAEAECNYCEGVCEEENFVELSAFSAVGRLNSVMVKWTTEVELDNAGFNVYRAESADGDYVKINAALIPAKNSPVSGRTYPYLDRDVERGKTYFYKIEDVDLQGNPALHGPVSATTRGPFGLFK